MYASAVVGRSTGEAQLQPNKMLAAMSRLPPAASNAPMTRAREALVLLMSISMSPSGQFLVDEDAVGALPVAGLGADWTWGCVWTCGCDDEEPTAVV